MNSISWSVQLNSLPGLSDLGKSKTGIEYQKAFNVLWRVATQTANHGPAELIHQRYKNTLFYPDSWGWMVAWLQPCPLLPTQNWMTVGQGPQAHWHLYNLVPLWSPVHHAGMYSHRWCSHLAFFLYFSLLILCLTSLPQQHGEVPVLRFILAHMCWSLCIHILDSTLQNCHWDNKDAQQWWMVGSLSAGTFRGPLLNHSTFLFIVSTFSSFTHASCFLDHLSSSRWRVMSSRNI